MNPTDEEFVVRLRDGDDLALNELINRWQQPVTRNIYRFLAIRQMLLIWRSRVSFEYSSKNLDLGGAKVRHLDVRDRNKRVENFLALAINV